MTRFEPVQASASYGVTIVSTELVSTSGEVIGTLKQNSVIRLTRERKSYFELLFDGQRCLVAKTAIRTGREFVEYLEEHPITFRKKIRIKEQTYAFAGKSVQSKIGPTLEVGQEFLVFGESKSWFKIQLDSGYYWASKSACSASYLLSVVSGKGNRLRTQITKYALQFEGNPYVWGGTSLTKGADCSGFVQSVFKEFEIALPRTSREQSSVGKAISVKELKPGDLVFYNRKGVVGHVALYIGDGQIIQANSPEVGIVITSINYNGNVPVCCRRVIANNG